LDDEAGVLLSKAGFRQPTPLQRAIIPHILARRDVVAEAGPGTGKTIALLAPLLVGGRPRGGGASAVILTADIDGLRKLQRQWKDLTRTAPTRPDCVAIGIEEGLRKEAHLLEQHPDVIMATPRRLIDHLRQGNLVLSGVRYAAADAPQEMDFHRDVEFILSKCAPQCQTITFVPTLADYRSPRARGRQPIVLRAQDWLPEEPEPRTREGQTGSAQRRIDVKDDARLATGTDEEALTAAIRNHLERIPQAPDPAALARVAGLVRRLVPLGRRSAFAAYLLLGREGAVKSEPGKLVRLFINAGRNRRIFPNDIYELFTAKLGIERAQLGDVKVLDNYSFVEIQARHAEPAITRLRGVELKGRKLTVDYARPRADNKRG
jgi:ATP-dependent RNA helicase DeaD